VFKRKKNDILIVGKFRFSLALLRTL